MDAYVLFPVMQVPVWYRPPGEGEFQKSMASWNNGHAVLQRERLSFVKVPAGGGEKQQPSLMAPPCRPPASPRRLQSYAFKEFTYRCKRTEDPHTTILHSAYGGVPLCVISSQITNTREIMRKNQKTSTKVVMKTSSMLRRYFRCVGYLLLNDGRTTESSEQCNLKLSHTGSVTN